MEKTIIMRRFIHQEVLKALVNARLPYDHEMGKLLEDEAQIVAPACVRIVDDQGGWIMLENRIRDLKVDPRFRDSVPSPAKVPRNDESSLRDNFEQIARGTAVVE